MCQAIDRFISFPLYWEISIGLAFLSLIIWSLWSYKTIQKHKYIESHLRSSEHLFELLFQTAPIPLFLIHSDFSISKTNQKSDSLLSLSESNSIGSFLQCSHNTNDPHLCGNQPECLTCPVRRIISETLQNKKGVSAVEVRLMSRHKEEEIEARYLISTSYIQESHSVFLSLQNITPLIQTQHQLQTALHERELLIKELYHRTRNNMNVIESMIELEFEQDLSPPIQLKIEAINSRIQAMALVHDVLYQSGDLSSIPLDVYLDRLSERIRMNHPEANGRIRLQKKLQPNLRTLIDLALPCGLVVNELLKNCYTHAFPPPRPGTIVLGVLYYDASHLQIVVRDNGVGFPSPQETPTSNFGMESSKQIVEYQLRGSFQIESSDQGVYSQMIIPLNSYTQRI